MAFRSSSNLAYAATGATCAIPVPAGATAGDIAVAFVHLEATGTITPPSGWNATAKWDSGLIGTHARATVWWKRLTGADSGTYSFAIPNTGHAGGCTLFSGRLASGDPFEAVSTNTATSTVVTCAALSPAAAGDDLYGAASSYAGGAWTPPSGMTERVDSDVDQNSADNVAAGSTGTKTFTCTGAGEIFGFLGALLPDTGGGSPIPPFLVMQTRRAY